MYQFQCDYNEGAHPRIMERLMETNFEQTVGYGEDHYCEAARDAVRKAIGRDDVDVHFLVGGTQANATVISSILRPYQGVLCASTGHINVHETGAIEHSGHKVLALPADDGLLTAAQIREEWKLIWQRMALNIWSSQEWFIFHSLPRWVRYIRLISSDLSAPYAVNTAFLFS